MDVDVYFVAGVPWAVEGAEGEKVVAGVEGVVVAREERRERCREMWELLAPIVD